MKKSKQLIVLMLIITLIVTVLTICNMFVQNEIVTQLLVDLQYVGIFITVLTFFVQQLSDQRTTASEFFIELKNTFIMDETFMSVYEHLYNYYIDNSYDLSVLPQKHIVQYLAYFDSVAIAHENKLISIEELDKTFSYYFFIAVNNPIVQQKELVVEGEFYPRIYWLYERLHDCQIRDNMPSIMEETALHKSEKYGKILEMSKQ